MCPEMMKKLRKACIRLDIQCIIKMIWIFASGPLSGFKIEFPGV